MIYLQKTERWVFESRYAELKDRHLVYEFFDTSQGGYHPQMEPAINTFILQKKKDARPMGGEILLAKYFGLRI